MSEHEFLDEPPPPGRETHASDHEGEPRLKSFLRRRMKRAESGESDDVEPVDDKRSSAAAPDEEPEFTAVEPGHDSAPRVRSMPMREYITPPLPSSLPNLRTTLPPKLPTPMAGSGANRNAWRARLLHYSGAAPPPGPVKEAHPAARARAAKTPSDGNRPASPLKEAHPAARARAAQPAAAAGAAVPAAPSPVQGIAATAAPSPVQGIAATAAPNPVQGTAATAAPSPGTAIVLASAAVRTSGGADLPRAEKRTQSVPPTDESPLAHARFAPKTEASNPEHAPFMPKPIASKTDDSQASPLASAAQPNQHRFAPEPATSASKPTAATNRAAALSSLTEVARKSLSSRRRTPSSILERLGARNPDGEQAAEPDRFPFEIDTPVPAASVVDTDAKKAVPEDGRRTAGPLAASKRAGGAVPGRRRPVGGDRDDGAPADLGSSGRDGGGPRGGRDKRWLIAAALVVVGLQAWTMQRLSAVSADLAEARANLAEARGSLDMLWSTTTQLDETQSVQQTVLQDSIRSVFAFAQGEIQLWQTAYDVQRQRLDDLSARVLGQGQAIARIASASTATNERVDALARNDESHTLRLDALEQQDRAHAAFLDAVANRMQSQESTLLGVSASMSSAQRMLAALDSDVSTLEGQIVASSSAQSRLASRVDAVAGWADAFRERDLTAPALLGQLGELADGLRRVSIRVDSLRGRGIPVRGGRGQPR